MSLIISITSLIISLLTFWLTRIKKGEIKMTRPSMICLLGQNGGDGPKIFIRTLLYSTSERGQYIQNIFIRLHHVEEIQTFSFWSHGEKNSLTKGSGLFINKSGVVTNHHFLLSKNKKQNFISGDYKLEVQVESINKSAKKIFEQNLTLNEDQLNDLQNNKAVFYEWDPDIIQYFSYTN